MIWGVGLRKRASLSDEHQVGHMFVYWRDALGLYFRGWYFNPADLPESQRASSEWRDYLFDHFAPGYMVDDIAMRDLIEERGQDYLLVWMRLEEVSLPNRLEASPSGDARCGCYSFNPDDFQDSCCHLNSCSGCYNCVSWAIHQSQHVRPGMIEPVRQGRVKLATEALESHVSRKDDLPS